METLNITKQNASAAYNVADANGKKLLEVLLGKDNVIPLNILDRVKTIEDAIALDAGWTDDDEFYLQSVKKAVIVTRVLNEGWKPDYANGKEPKWYIWMEYDKAASAFRFHFTDFVYSVAHSASGSRHVFKDAKTAKYFAENFTKLINQIIL